MVHIAGGAVANGLVSGYDICALPDFARMIGLASHSGFDWKGTRP
jgi:hypothetical protein